MDQKVSEWTPYDRKKKRGRPDIQKRLGVLWGRAAQNRNTWKEIGQAYARDWEFGIVKTWVVQKQLSVN